MISFLFWNLNKKPLQDQVARLAKAYDLDVLILAESGIDPITVTEALKAAGRSPYSFPESESRKVQVFTRFPKSRLVEKFNAFIGGLNVRNLKMGPPPGILLAVVHFPGLPGWADEDQKEGARELAREIAFIEGKLQNDRTVLVGDFNMNPFHDGMVSAFGLHAVMAREVARAGQRVVQGKPWRFFYNPMWACFGDRPPGPPGTFFLSSSKPINHFWHILDQVLVRPSLMDKLNNVRIVASLDNDGEPSLLDHLGHPLGTDHLPIFFQLDL